ncbi:hypothetical protein VNI00_019261 [Paramarasmius palmivorus]|uniref:Uncharacterized protein n=1 Tax=Paramarasmius palmivorus TaxID=297713 RepID=A0AAW0ARN9_9AGAR
MIFSRRLLLYMYPLKLSPSTDASSDNYLIHTLPSIDCLPVQILSLTNIPVVSKYFKACIIDQLSSSTSLEYCKTLPPKSVAIVLNYCRISLPATYSKLEYSIEIPRISLPATYSKLEYGIEIPRISLPATYSKLEYSIEIPWHPTNPGIPEYRKTPAPAPLEYQETTTSISSKSSTEILSYFETGQARYRKTSPRPPPGILEPQRSLPTF